MKKIIFLDDAIRAVDERIKQLSKDEVFRRKNPGGVIDLYGIKENLMSVPALNGYGKIDAVVNLNDPIRFKLNDYGRDVYYHQYDELISLQEKVGAKHLIERRFPKTDADGYTEMQFWHFIETFGPYIGMCRKNIFESINVVFPIGYFAEEDTKKWDTNR